MKIILASNSPRRKELLEYAGIPFVVETKNVEEQYDPNWKPEEIVKHLSMLKAKPVAAEHKDSPVLGADTIVVLEKEVMGKPKTEERAKEMLRKLSGKTHRVFTGVTLIKGEEISQFTVETKVTFFELTEEQIEKYVATGEPLDKAGAYGIQGKGGLLVEKVEGDYFNIIGLPIGRVVREIEKFK